MLAYILHLRSFSIRRITLCLMMLVLSLRALVPAGFMPDAGALRDGRLEMSFCTADGLKTFTVDTQDTNGAPSSDAGHGHQITDCPFNLMTSLPTVLSMAPVVAGLSLLVWSVQPAPTPAALPPMPAQGPPLGSRAPPLP